MGNCLGSPVPSSELPSQARRSQGCRGGHPGGGQASVLPGLEGTPCPAGAQGGSRVRPGALCFPGDCQGVGCRCLGASHEGPGPALLLSACGVTLSSTSALLVGWPGVKDNGHSPKTDGAVCLVASRVSNTEDAPSCPLTCSQLFGNFKTIASYFHQHYALL